MSMPNEAQSVAYTTDQDVSKGSVFYLWFICLVAACGGLLFGYDAVVVSGTNSQVLKQFQFTPAELGFYVSCVLWGCAIGSGVAGFISDALGRKKLLILASILIFISATWSGLAASPLQLILARLLGGFGIGVSTMVCPLYISEVSPEKFRGRMVTLFQFTITIGIVMCVFANWGIFSFAESHAESENMSTFWRWFAVDENWRAMFFSEAIPGILFLVCAFFIPESPRWLVNQGRSKEALSILTKINGYEKAEAVCKDIEEAVKKESNVIFGDLFTQRLRKPLILCVLICVLTEASGVSVIFYYGPQIFEAAGFGLGGSLGGFATIALVNMIATIFALKYVDSAGRRKLLGVGTVGSIVSHFVIGYLFLNGINGWPIVIAINAFVAFFACALGPVKFVVLSEVFPNRIRGKAIAIATTCIWLTSAGVAQIFPIMQASMNTGFIFFCFAIELFFLLAVVKYMMPETKGRTIEEIERSW
ncbi:sugar porter family MFS transporter [Photobacterium sagamiensis]|uniref:sugar porter family MFS transporter n=1 Tax=Photobacterium sagamiensis TaxID=2910241 RepID=UPI003D120B3F